MRSPSIHRRHFLKTVAGAAGLLAMAPLLQQAAEPQNSQRILKIGVVGCGGRGLGAAADALHADPGTVVWALADVFDERLTAAEQLLTQQFGDRFQAPAERRFAGLDAYKKLLETDVDLVILATPPAFRPEMLAAAVKANKHLYVEKPVAVDVPGILSVLNTSRIAKSKQLVILDGFCWRYDAANIAAHEQLSAGTLGKVLTFDAKYYTTPPKSPLALNSRPAGESDLSWALRNWTAWNWLSGGQFVEQICHSVDGMLWSFGEELPIAAKGTGGRAQRKDDGDVWDHYDIYFEYADGREAHISCRQWNGCHGEIADRTICEKGTLHTPYRPHIQSERRWRYRGEPTNMYAQTHIELMRHIREGNWKQTLEDAANKTLVAILGREAAHTGQRILLEDLKKNTTRLMPEKLGMDSKLPPAKIPVPGRY